MLAVGPSLELGTEYPVLPTPSAGSTVELNGRTYTVMAVVYPLNPVTQLTVQQGAGDKFNLSFIIPSEHSASSGRTTPCASFSSMWMTPTSTQYSVPG